MLKVSIVIVTHNRANYLKQAIDSVLNQYFLDWELIIIDDYSTDKTEEVVGEYLKLGKAIKYIKNEKNLGIAKSRNLALSLCSGKYVAVLDSDDEWVDKNKLSKQVGFLDSNSDYVLCGGMAKIINEFGSKIGEIRYQETDGKIRKKILVSNQFIHSSVVFRKTAFDMVDGYSDYKIGEDYDLFLKLGLKGKFFNFSDFFVSYRKHGGGVTWSDRKAAVFSHLKIIKKFKLFYPNYYLALSKAYLRIGLAVLSFL